MFFPRDTPYMNVFTLHIGAGRAELMAGEKSVRGLHSPRTDLTSTGKVSYKNTCYLT
ncbi:Cell division GTPase FtsZ [Pseudomonas syringae pv. actinidiae]|uniref:Cell division GTPase FtsZ n=1 Tax=Pseudomonas syringae pv. actinidiae TaxID=103796 RepID=A0AAN4TJB7_PSESF|nr:Cell division GTPase FtsZ [Pseudomonas syringae pv. actinidiae]